MLTCQQLTELITEYLEGRMSLWRRAQFQMHLGMCRHCRAYLKQMKVTTQTLGRLPSEPIPPNIKSELLRRFRDMPLQKPDAESGGPGSGPVGPRGTRGSV